MTFLRHLESDRGGRFAHPLDGATLVALIPASRLLAVDPQDRRAVPTAQAVAELRRHAGSQFDPDVVEALPDVAGGRADARLTLV